MSIRVNKKKSIGKVLFIVEGSWTEPYILRRVFTTIFDYQVETKLRGKHYHKYNSKENATSQVFVVNAEESNIINIRKDNQYLDKLFAELIENYDFNIDNAATYYIFDRDRESNKDEEFIENMLNVLVNSRDNVGYDRQGLLLLSYPSIESFTVSNFEKNSFDTRIDTGKELKKYAHQNNYNHQRINEETLLFAVKEMLRAFDIVGEISLDVDNFSTDNKKIYDYEEEEFKSSKVYRLLGLLVIALIDLGLIEIQEEYEKSDNRAGGT